MKIPGNKLTEFKELYYDNCYCLEGRCRYNKCQGKTWKKNLKHIYQLKKFTQLKLFQ